MEEYTKYSLEGALSLFISVLAYRMYRMRCNTNSECCDKKFQADFHNGGGDIEDQQI